MDFSHSPGPEEASPLTELGLPARRPLSDLPSPVPVDRDQIRDLLEGRLAFPEFQRVYRLIHTYREWHEVEGEVLLEQYETWRKLQSSLKPKASGGEDSR